MSARRSAFATGCLCLALYVLATACDAPQTPAQRALESLKVGDDYPESRSRLLAAGWQPVPARCSEQFICFAEWPEMVTRLADRETCGVWIAGGDKVMLCLRPIPDGAMLESIEPFE